MASGSAARLWSRRTWRSDLLLPVALLYGALIGIRRALYRIGLYRTRLLGVPTIVVGNLAVGGTGKTPLVIALVTLLQRHGFHPGIISRGYGGRYAHERVSWAEVTSNDAQRFGDEIVLIHQRSGAPCAVAKQRALAGRALCLAHPEIDVLIADDGLQHYALARTLELAVFDERGIGNGRLLPAGPLREPLARLATVNAIVLNGATTVLPQAALRHAGPAPIFNMQMRALSAFSLSDPKLLRDLSAFTQLPQGDVLAIAGIGHPQRFFTMLRAHGLEPRTLALSDHYAFADDFFAHQHASAILMTEKDAVKCRHIDDSRCWVVPIEAQLEKTLQTFILEALHAPRRT